MSSRLHALKIFALSALLAHPASAAWQDNWEEIPVSRLPALAPDGDLASLRLALNRQLVSCEEHKTGHFRHCLNETLQVPIECDVPVLEKLLKIATESKSWSTYYQKAKSSFIWYRYKPTPGQVQFTGYNTPLFEGTLKQDARHRFPVFKRPSDLVDIAQPDGKILWGRRLPDGSIVPYDDRATIDIEGSLAGKGLETAYFEFSSDLLRLHIEGSGIFRVDLGKAGTRDYVLNFAGKNGHPFVSVFKVMRDHGVDRKYLTFPGLKQYFIDFPDQMWPTLRTNPSYVFFSLGEEPPCGTVKAHLTPGHTIAVDPTQLPLGMTTLIEASRPVEGSDPNGGSAPMKPFTRFAVGQDTGSAIKLGHVDVYWGTGDYATLASNLMNSRGNLYIMKLNRLFRIK